MSSPIVVVGAGPAGVRAAQTLVAHGLRPVLVDEAPRGGGQIYRQPPPGLERPAKALYGFEAGRAQALHKTLEALLPQVEHRPDTLVWNAQPPAHGGTLDLLHGPSATTHTLPYGQLLLATGATDRVMPVPGWTLPGVFSLGGAQVALKAQGCAIGRRVVFAGTGPLLYLVAWQYLKAGVHVAAVLDSARLADQVHALPRLASQPVVLAKGAWFVARLLAAGVPVHHGARALRLLGSEGGQGRASGVAGPMDAVKYVAWTDGRHEQITPCDGVGLGHGLRSETQLADLLGCAFDWQPLHRAWLPQRDVAGRTSVSGVYLAGDGAGILGADAAEWAGERAALALLADRGASVDANRAHWLEQRLARATQFRQGLEQAFPFPQDWAAQTSDDTVICRCEALTAGDLRQAAKDTGASELNRLKALCRVGMGRCQGRMCGAAAAELLAQACGQPVQAVGRLRAQAPIKPIPLALQAVPLAGPGTEDRR